MELRSSKKPQYSPTVQSLQRKLNVIRKLVHGNWPDLDTDGKFGTQTELAVKGFQQYRGITPVSGIVGDTTMRYIEEVCNSIRSTKVSLEESKTDNTLLNKLNDFVTNEIFGILENINDTAGKQIKFLRQFDPNGDNEMLRILVNKNLIANPKLKELQGIVKEILTKQEKIDGLVVEAGGDTNYYHRMKKHKIGDVLRRQGAQRQLSLETQSLKRMSDAAKKLYMQCMEDLQKANLARKIDQYMRNSPKIIPKGRLTGVGVLKFISLIPLLTDIWAYGFAVFRGEPSEEKGKKVISGLIGLVEGFILGILIGALVAALGLTGGVAIAAVVIIGLIVGLLIALFCPEDTLIEWISMEVVKLFHSPVVQTTARSSWV